MPQQLSEGIDESVQVKPRPNQLLNVFVFDKELLQIGDTLEYSIFRGENLSEEYIAALTWEI